MEWSQYTHLAPRLRAPHWLGDIGIEWQQLGDCLQEGRNAMPWGIQPAGQEVVGSHRDHTTPPGQHAALTIRPHQLRSMLSNGRTGEVSISQN